jgi:hypothetical protein
MELDCFAGRAPVVGMVHLPALPGAPGYGGDRDAIRERALRDAEALASGGADGLLVENYGDAPYYPERVPRHVVAAMTDVAGRVARAVDLPVGVNVLRNDAASALSVAAATGAAFVRVNVHVGARVTDQGIVEGRAHETARLRKRLDADVEILADVGVKHSAALGGDRSPASVAEDAVERGLADGLIVSGDATGRSVDANELRAVAGVGRRLGVPTFVGSGVTPESAADLLDAADGLVVGTAVKEDGETTAPVEEERVADLVAAVRRSR